MSKPLVSIVMGSDSDLEIMREAGKASKVLGFLTRLTLRSATVRPTALQNTRATRPNEESALSLPARAEQPTLPE